MATPSAPRSLQPSTHHHTRTHTQSILPSSSTNTTSSCSTSPRKMSLSKGATFHVRSSAPAEDDPVLSIYHLARRSPTGSQSSLASLAYTDIAAQSIQDFEQTFSGARGRRSASNRRGSDELGRRNRSYKTAPQPSDEGLGSSISGSSDTGLSKTFDTALDLGADSALGTSIEESILPPSIAHIVGFEDDSAKCRNLIQDTETLLRQQGNKTNTAATSVSRSAVISSIAPFNNHTSPQHPRLSKSASKTLVEKVLNPLLREDRFKFFHPLVDSLRPSSNKVIKCLRDLEHSLIYEPLNLSPPPGLYRAFGEFSIQLVVDTYHHLSEPEQRRVADSAYDGGYFLDMVQQVGRLAAHIARDREARVARQGQATEDSEEDEMAYSPDDEYTLEGGIAETGQNAELVRWKNGKGTSMKTNQEYEPAAGTKRQHSNESMDEDAVRSMARRKKNAEPKSAMQCPFGDCDKTFIRQCDLSKHEKSHSRPFKCHVRDCKFHAMGLPTQKELDRHVNDKHDSNAMKYECPYDNCGFKTKRESNLKQHKEKQHGWQYNRVKGKARSVQTPAQTPQTPNMEYSPSTESVSSSHMGFAHGSGTGSVPGSTMVTPLEQPLQSFDTYSPDSHYSLFPRTQAQLPSTSHQSSYDSLSSYAVPPQTPHTGYSSTNHPMSMMPDFTTTPITPASSSAQSFPQSPYTYDMSIGGQPSYNTDVSAFGNNYFPAGVGSLPATLQSPSPYYNTGMPTPASQYLQPTSRDPSISWQSPMAQGAMDQFFTTPSETHAMRTTDMDNYNHSHNFNNVDVLPAEDFDLYGGSSALATVTGVSSGEGQMFQDMTMDFNYDDEELEPDINDYLNIH